MTAPVNLAAHILDIYDFLPLSNRNLIVDGNKDVWSSAAAVALATGATYPSCVMYRVAAGTGGAGTYQQGTLGLGAYNRFGFGTSAKYFGTTSITTASTGTLAARSGPQLGVTVEGVNTLAGASATLSLWLWAPSGSITIQQVYAVQVFGTGGSPTANTTTLVPVNWVLGPTPQRFSVRIDVPSIVSATLGTTAGTDYLAVGVSLPVGSTYAVGDAQWQLEQCSPYAPAQGMPTAFEYRGAQAELARVQRFYCTGTTRYDGYATSGVNFSAYSRFPVSMRAIPTITLTNSLTPVQFAATVGVNATLTADCFNELRTATATGGAVFGSTYVADARF